MKNTCPQKIKRRDVILTAERETPKKKKVRLDRQVNLSFASICAVAALHKDVHT